MDHIHKVSRIEIAHDDRPNRIGYSYRQLTDDEIALLQANNNYAEDWSQVWVCNDFHPHLIQSNRFYGIVRIGNTSDIFLKYKDLTIPCGIYNSSISNCDIGHDNAIHHVKYMAHFIIDEEVMLSNINEMSTSPTAKFGNGILYEGESEDKRIWIEVCNENGGRAILPFVGMSSADAYLWSRHRHDTVLQQQFIAFTDKYYSNHCRHYSRIGNHTVIKNSNTIKDVYIGDYAYIKGVNKLKNITVQSCKAAMTQIGEGCEIVNGIIGIGCRIFYGVKAVRFVLSSFSQLKYGARLINSFLGENSTISCCEVLNALIFPAHEQHHNNSFLCAALLKGQSNLAAGATLGSNHNSRAADGEFIAGRGFWPGLCVSIKHNSSFASYTLLGKGDYPYELHIQFPFSLVLNDSQHNQLIILPAYWFMYNTYALMRNSWKYMDRDKRIDKSTSITYDILAPDTVNEIIHAMDLLEIAVGKALTPNLPLDEQQQIGKNRLISDDDLSHLTILMDNVENSNRPVLIRKVKECYRMYYKILHFYCSEELVRYFDSPQSIDDFLDQREQYDRLREDFENIGGQLINKPLVDNLIKQIKTNKITSWNDVQQTYQEWGQSYPTRRFQHAISTLASLYNRSVLTFNKDFILQVLQESLMTKEWLLIEIRNSRSKDYHNPFRQIVYENFEELEAVMGKLDENAFIQLQENEYRHYKQKVERLCREDTLLK